ncbi:MAG TPA: 3-methyl-2-oxobutanoate hydroxymethyltransferase [Firmicutes bacterium]|nr:3-methyl-2-oxobutanoate hydroxymethyltransferase [Bacillota bacterium]
MQERKKVTIETLRAMKRQGEKATFITAYDYPLAKYAERAGIDMILVGDSLGMTVLGHKTTLPVTMDDMIRASQAVTRGAKAPFIIGDMPFMSYQPSDRDAVINAGRFISEANCDAVKLEGGRRVAERVKAIAGAGIVVMGHLGLTPQALAQMGGYRVQGKSLAQYRQLLDDALALEDAGAHMLLLEAIPNEVAALIHDQLQIPVYGIGAGSGVDGQLVIIHDLIGMFDEFKPKFVKRYAEVGQIITEAIAAYCREVKEGVFPGPEHYYPIPPEQLTEIMAYVTGKDKDKDSREQGA